MGSLHWPFCNKIGCICSIERIPWINLGCRVAHLATKLILEQPSPDACHTFFRTVNWEGAAEDPGTISAIPILCKIVESHYTAKTWKSHCYVHGHAHTHAHTHAHVDVQSEHGWNSGWHGSNVISREISNVSLITFVYWHQMVQLGLYIDVYIVYLFPANIWWKADIGPVLARIGPISI